MSIGMYGSTAACWSSTLEILPEPQDNKLDSQPVAPNFRDVSQACVSWIKPGMMFRSSEAYGLDVVRKHKIQTILDLRKLHKCCFSKDVQVHEEYPEICNLCSPNFPRWGTKLVKVFHVDFIPPNVGMYIVSKMPLRIWWKLAKVVWMGGDPGKVMCPAVADPELMGFEQLYITFLDKSGDNIAKALKVFANPANFPVLVHCIHGKDRTGMVVMLILLLCGVPVEAILEDYTYSETSLRESKARNELLMPDYLQQDAVITSKRSHLQAALDHIDAKYGGILPYLTKIGITRDELLSIQDSMMSKLQ